MPNALDLFMPTAADSRDLTPAFDGHKGVVLTSQY
jgi:hypothetical protein